MSLETIKREFVIKGLTPQQVFAVVTDYDCYPRILPEFTGVKVLSSSGDHHRVEFRAKVVVEIRYVLDIVHDATACTTRWTFVEGEVVSDSRGGWTLSACDEGTNVNYEAGLAVKAPLPRFMVNKVSNMIIGTTIPNMFKAVEREALARSNYAK